jgi:epoxyqueuosine reductase
MQWISENIGEVSGRAFVDSAPVLERAWASKSGLGWIGKNGNLINKGSGSFYFLSELIIDLTLEPDQAIPTNHCGTCTACIDACPTQAIESPAIINGSKCISYYTIELKDAIPNEMKGKFDDWIFGCDTCQDVCPWNRFVKPHHERAFLPNQAISNYNTQDWIELTEDVFKKTFKNSPIMRTKYNGLKRNIDYINK